MDYRNFCAKFIGILLLTFFLAPAMAVFGQTWHTMNQATIEWDPVTTIDGSPLPTGDIIKYRVWLANAVTDPEKSNPTQVGGVDGPIYTITLNVEGKYYVGVQAVRYTPNGGGGYEEIASSGICWADNAECSEPTDGPFALRYFVAPDSPKNMRIAK
jgi:hypothetical protein